MIFLFVTSTNQTMMNVKFQGVTESKNKEIHSVVRIVGKIINVLLAVVDSGEQEIHKGLTISNLSMKVR